MSAVPREVLAEALRAAIDGGTVRAAVLTTFALEWAFALDEVLPTFVPHSLSASPNARREELADHLLATGTALSLYYDARHAGDFERTSRVPLAMVPVSHPTGFFHPKVIMALVQSDEDERLVVACGSANLTRAGWWEWVEGAHITTIEPRERTWSRDSLLGFLSFLQRHSVNPTDRVAPERIAAFLRETRQAKRRSTADEAVARFVWNGARGGVDAGDAVADLVGDFYAGGRLEIVSPWFSDAGDAVLDRLRAQTKVAEVRALVPEDADGRAELPRAAVRRLGEAVTWSSLPQDITSSGPLPEAQPRRVHAKVYRLTAPRRPQQTLLVGSFNLTKEAFGARQNVEAGFLLDLATGGNRPWLEPRDAPTAFAPERSEDEIELLPQSRTAPLRLSYDWVTRESDAQWVGGDVPGALDVVHGAVTVMNLGHGWQPGPLPLQPAEKLRQHLLSSSPVLSVVTPDGSDLGLTVVTERHVFAKPIGDSARSLSDAVAELLLASQRRPGGDANGEAGEPGDPPPVDQPHQRTVFDGFAALYQGLASFRDDVTDLVAEGRTTEVDHRLVGESSRCLGDLLTQAERVAVTEPTMSLVVCWGVRDVLASLDAGLSAQSATAAATALRRTEELRVQVERSLAEQHAGDPVFTRFLDWAGREFGRVVPS